MKNIKFLKNKNIILNNTTYKPYTLGNLPNSFGFKEQYVGKDEEGNEKYKYGKDNWFNYKGLTYIEMNELPW
tara:strand:+ start:334 stop:549 length:216 start_codon:yes stop_codon:yes gene_type:complete